VLVPVPEPVPTPDVLSVADGDPPIDPVHAAATHPTATIRQALRTMLVLLRVGTRLPNGWVAAETAITQRWRSRGQALDVPVQREEAAPYGSAKAALPFASS
jgi:hypothetical protein